MTQLIERMRSALDTEDAEGLGDKMLSSARTLALASIAESLDIIVGRVSSVVPAKPNVARTAGVGPKRIGKLERRFKRLEVTKRLPGRTSPMGEAVIAVMEERLGETVTAHGIAQRIQRRWPWMEKAFEIPHMRGRVSSSLSTLKLAGFVFKTPGQNTWEIVPGVLLGAPASQGPESKDFDRPPPKSEDKFLRFLPDSRPQGETI
jgi:hypothetical protein